jgi:hypothetical protein
MAHFHLIITTDYELPNDKQPDVMNYMIKPTRSLLDDLSPYGAKLTIMFEIGEMWAFEKDANQGFSKYLGYDVAEVIRGQLVQAIRKGHLHPQWLNARWEQGRWKLDYSKYRLTDLDYSELVELFQRGKGYLEALLGGNSADYSCVGFRAGNWITQPSGNYLRALHSAGLKSDTSVFKWAYSNTPSVFIDYRNATSNVLPWFACWDDINRPSSDGRILEVPIYAEAVSLLGLLSAKRLRSASQYFREDRQIAQEVKASSQREGCARCGLLSHLSRVLRLYPKKLDFCKLSWREMVRMIENVHRRYAEDQLIDHVSIVMIGHSKESLSSGDLRRFLEVISEKYRGSISFSTYRDFVQQYWLTAYSNHREKIG